MSTVPEKATHEPDLKGLVIVGQADGPRKVIISKGEDNVQIYG